MRVLFSQTVRVYMSDPSLYSAEKTWTAEENKLANALLAAVRADPNANDEDYIWSVHGGRQDVRDVWWKLHTFPHMFEVYAAKGEDLMRYDLQGEPRRAFASESRLTQLVYRSWKVSISDVDALLDKGILEPSAWELLANVLRFSLPRDVLLRRAHELRSKKTGLEHLPKHTKEPRVQIFPYRSNSKQWAVFIVTWVEVKRYTLRGVVPMDYDDDAFSWAVSHLQFQYQIKTEPELTQWPSNTGAQLLIADGLCSAFRDEMSTTSSSENRDLFVSSTLDTLRQIKAAAERTWNSNIEELCSEDAALHAAFQKLF